MRASIGIGLAVLCASMTFGQPARAATAGARGLTTQPGMQVSVQANQRPVAVPVPSEKAMRYYRSGVTLWILGTIWGFLVPALLLFTGASASIRNWVQRIGRKWFFVIAVYFVVFSIISFVLDLPLSYYGGFVRQHAFDLSNQTFQKWFGDELKGLLIGLVIGALFLWVPYLLLKRSPERWWFYTGLLVFPFLLLLLLIKPVWLDPLFNDFGPMQDKALESRILSLAERAGIEGSRVYEVNKSADTRQLNAYVVGMGGTKRIVLWDTILQKLDERELLTVMGHEMGHYVLGHTWKMVLFFSALIMATLYAIHRTAGWLIAKYRDRIGFDHLSDIASLPLILLLFGLYLFAATPFALIVTRHFEHEADRFGLEITRDNHAAATAFVKLIDTNLNNPRPGLLVKLWQASHPTTGDRIDFANEYRPWERNEPLKYGHLFHEPR